MTTDPSAYQPSSEEAFMNPMQVAWFRSRLLADRAALHAELEAVPHTEAEQPDREGDQTDHASADSEREFELLNRARIQALLHQTDAALMRIENGTYGYCEDTGEPIGLKRLMAQPASALSLEAQEARERKARG